MQISEIIHFSYRFAVMVTAQNQTRIFLRKRHKPVRGAGHVTCARDLQLQDMCNCPPQPKRGAALLSLPLLYRRTKRMRANLSEVGH
jgi:hypothetical protein